MQVEEWNGSGIPKIVGGMSVLPLGVTSMISGDRQDVTGEW